MRDHRGSSLPSILTNPTTRTPDRYVNCETNRPLEVNKLTYGPAELAAPVPGAAASVSSSVHTQGLSVDPSGNRPPAPETSDSVGVSFRHSFWQDHRRLVGSCIAEAFYSPNRQHRFQTCGSRAWVQRSVEPIPRYRVISTRCKDRWCEACARERRHKIAANLVRKLPPGRLRFVTLTLKTTTDDIGTAARRMIRAFHRLRQDKRLKA
ncbi:MAG: hypothetical protein WAO15_23595, partial [Mycobacterium sp.]